ncbi:hypothetical protein F5882DRAFT_514243 [Hyaloscypha sp. PMI_1271]|nr:hypothetical protein F5882DRAFT_514243 [Hyaloscypha sp. PMI_1271]
METLGTSIELEAVHGSPRSRISGLSGLLHWRQNSPDEESHDAQIFPNIDEENTSFPILRAAKPAEVGKPINAKVDDILKIVCEHEKFSVPRLGDRAVKDLPSFDDITPYDITYEQQKVLWRKEVERLIEVVNKLDTVPVFSGTERLANNSKDSYETLALLADKVYSSLSLCIHDNEAMFLEHRPTIHNEEWYKRSQDVLRRLVDETEAKENENENEISLSSKITAEELFLFLNYLTAAVARIVCTSAYGKNFHDRILAMIAKWSTKVKVVSAKLDVFSQISLEKGAAHEAASHPRQPSETTETRGLRKEWGELLERLEASRASQESESVLVNRENALKLLYYFNATRYQTLLWDIFRHFLISVRGANRVKTSVNTSFELCSVVYETGFSRFPTLIFQDLDNEFLGTSDLDVVNTVAHGAFSMAKLSVNHVLQNQKVRKSSENASSEDASHGVPTKLSWSWNECREQSMYLESMNDIITVLVPLQLTSPAVTIRLHKAIMMIIFTEGDREQSAFSIVPYEQSKFKAFFCLTTDEYQIQSGVRKDLGASSLSKALMMRDKLVAGKSVGKIFTGTTTLPLDRANSGSRMQTVRGQNSRISKEIEEADKEMSDWVFEEKGVMVRCELYVWSVMAIATILILGGITVGVTVHGRIPGVDPFQIAAYCWILAVASILIAKSLRVESWSWRHFLMRRVLCRSISELHAVTGINKQLILAKLVNDEDITILTTRGPYNCPFLRKSDDGFSIDEPLSMWTMLRSGLIMLRVQTPQGGALVCLDVRRGKEYSLVSQENMPTEETEYICCDRIPPRDGKLGTEYRIRLKSQPLGWHGVVGVHCGHDSLFV